MRILVYGAGVLGSFLAHNLFVGKKDVTLLARGDRANTIRENGLVIKHKLKCKTTKDKIKVVESLAPDDDYDIIFVVMQYIHLDGIIPILQRNCSETVVFVGNNMSAERISSALPEKNVLFGFLGVGGRKENGKVIGISLGSLTIGSLSGNDEYKLLIEDVFAGLKYKIKYCNDMNAWLKSHAAFILPIAFACYYADGNLKKVAKKKEMLHTIIRATQEGYTVLKSIGFAVVPEEDYDYVMNKSKSYYRMLKLMCATFIGKLAASAHAMSAIPEMRALSAEFDKLINKAKIDMPAWMRLKQYLPEE